jgi:hypothetical protein
MKRVNSGKSRGPRRLLALLLVAVLFTGLWPLSVFASEDLPDYPKQNWRYEYRDDDAGRAGTGTVNKGTRSVTFQREEIAFENFAQEIDRLHNQSILLYQYKSDGIMMKTAIGGWEKCLRLIKQI